MVLKIFDEKVYKEQDSKKGMTKVKWSASQKNVTPTTQELQSRGKISKFYGFKPEKEQLMGCPGKCRGHGQCPGRCNGH